MRSAFDHPLVLFEQESESTSGYVFEYVRLYKPCFLLSSWLEGLFYRIRLFELGLNPFSFSFVYKTCSLKRHQIDVLLSFDTPQSVEQKKDFSSHDQGPVCDAYRSQSSFIANSFQQLIQKKIQEQLSTFTLKQRIQNLTEFEGYKVLHVENLSQEMSLSPKDTQQVDSILTPSKESQIHQKNKKKKIVKELSQDIICLPKGYRPQYAMRRAFLCREKRCLLSRHLLPLTPPEIVKAHMHFQTHYEERENIFCSHSQMTPTPEKLNEVMLFLHDPSLLSHGDTFLFDAIACGAVMVAPFHPSYIELGFVHQKNCLFYKAGDMQDLAAHVYQALKNPKKLAEMAREAVSWMHTYFSPKALAEKLELVLEAKVRNKEC